MQPFASVTVRVPGPAHKLVGLLTVCPPGAQENKYPGVPSAGTAVALPLQILGQLWLMLVTLTLRATGWVMVKEAVPVQPLMSVTVTE